MTPRFIVYVQNFLPGLSPIRCLEQSPLFIRTPKPPEGTYKYNVIVFGMDRDAPGLECLVEPHILPGLTTIS